jgi:excisionase family DNA binding protein
MSSPKDVLNLLEVARLLGVHVETVRRLARNNEIPAFKVGRGWRIRRDALINWEDTQQYQSRQGTILVVDDDSAVQTVIRRILEKQGYRCIEAEDGAEGLDMLHRNRVDAVFLDLQLPVMTGPDFLRELRSDHMDVPVTLITGYPDSDLVVEAGRYGPVTLLVKPIKRGQLIQAVRNMLPGSVQFSE